MATLQPANPMSFSHRDEGQIDQIQDEQDELRDARETLGGVRSRLRTKRCELRGSREDVANKIAKSIDIIKQFLHEQNIDLPPAIQGAVDTADAARDTFGPQEVEYEEAEEDYNAKEWAYTVQETQFIDRLYSYHESQQHMPTGPLNDNTDVTSVNQTFVASPDAWEVSNPPPFIVDNALDDENPPDNLALTPLKRTNTVEPSEHAPVARPVDAHQPQPRDMDYAPPSSAPPVQRPSNHDQLRWSHTRERIDAWLLQILEGSKFHKAQLHNLLLGQGLDGGDLHNLLLEQNLDGGDWWQLVIWYWTSRSPVPSTFHTGDTIASSTSSANTSAPNFDGRELADAAGSFRNTSDSTSAITMQRLFEEPETTDPDLRPSSATPLVQDDRNLDALETTEFPSEIKFSEMLDRKPKHVTFEESDSASTEPNMATSSSSEKVPSSASSVHGGPCRTASPSPGLRLPDERLRGGNNDSGIGSSPVRNPRHEEPGTQDGHLPHSILDTAHGNLTQPGGIPSGKHLLKDAQLLASRTAKDPESAKSELIGSFTDPQNNDYVLVPFTGPSWNNGSDSKLQFPQDESRTWHPFALFIRVKSGSKMLWSLPLLRLTPLPTQIPDPPRNGKCGRLENIPFVDSSNTPNRLPGPSGLPGLSSADVYQ
jgi:hypothetical protein